jgi:PAS domain S-box-containing protein
MPDINDEPLPPENGIASDKIIHDLNHIERRFRTIFERSSFGNKIINSKLEIIKVNSALITLLGYSQKELLGTQIKDIAHPDFIAPWNALQEQLWTLENETFSFEACIIKKDKSVLWCQVTSILFPDQGQTFGYTIIEDISLRKALEEQVKQTNVRNLKIQKAQQQKILDVVISTQEEERKRIANSLHNNLGQMFYGVRLHLDQVNPIMSDPEKNKSSLIKAKELLSDCINETRRISHELSPTVLEDFGLIGAIQDSCSKSSDKVNFKYLFAGISEKLHKSLEIAIYRIVQELILNVIKHAEASVVKITVTVYKAAVIIIVEDDGKGFEPNKQKDKGFGLKYLKNRLQVLKGNLKISSSTHKGTIVNVTLPNHVS